MILPAITQTRGDLAPLLNKIHHADALDLLRRLPSNSVDMVLCDLPYGVTACEWDTVIPIEPMWEQLRRVVKRRAAIVLTATEPFASRLRMSAIKLYKYDWQWDKVKPSGMMIAKMRPMQQIEYALVFSRGTIATGSPNHMNYYPIMTQREKQIKGKVYSKSGSSPLWALNNNYLRVYDTKYPISLIRFPHDIDSTHPTQKPVALFEYLIKTYTQAGEIVLDMTCGSGTTAIAARKTGRQFICGDLSAEYVEVARKRLQNTDPYQATILPDGRKQLSLFEAVL